MSLRIPVYTSPKGPGRAYLTARELPGGRGTVHAELWGAFTESVGVCREVGGARHSLPSRYRSPVMSGAVATASSGVARSGWA